MSDTTLHVRAYFRASRTLHRGHEVMLWYEAHPDFGKRLWQIDLQGQHLTDYRESFNPETDKQMNTWLILLGDLVASLAVAPLLVMWNRRVKARVAAQQPATENTVN